MGDVLDRLLRWLPDFRTVSSSRRWQIAMVCVLVLMLVASPFGFFLLCAAAMVTITVASPVGLANKLTAEWETWRRSHPRIASVVGQLTGSWHHIAALGAVATSAVMIAQTHELPPDDLLRHAVAWRWNFDSRAHYPESIFHHAWSWWIGWEQIFGFLAEQGLSLPAAIGLVRGMLVWTTGTLAWLCCWKLLGGPAGTPPKMDDHADALGGEGLSNAKPFAVAAFAILFYVLIWGRLTFGRPEAILFFSLLLGATAPRRTLWLAIMVPLIPVYWMSPVYAAGAMMHPVRSARDLITNMMWAAAFASIAGGFWLTYSGGEYLQIGAMMAPALDFSRHKVAELQSNVATFGQPGNLALMLGLAAVWSVYARRLRRSRATGIPRDPQLVEEHWTFATWLFAAIVLSLPDMVRYMPYILAILFLGSLVMVRRLLQNSSTLPAGSAPGMAVLAAIAVLVANVHLPATQDRMDGSLLTGAFVVPPDSRVLAQFNTSAYVMTASNPMARVTPVYEIGGVTKGVREVVASFSLGRWPPCSFLARYDYVFEQGVWGPLPDCVRVLAKAKDFTLWRVVAGPLPG